MSKNSDFRQFEPVNAADVAAWLLANIYTNEEDWQNFAYAVGLAFDNSKLAEIKGSLSQMITQIVERQVIIRLADFNRKINELDREIATLKSAKLGSEITAKVIPTLQPPQKYEIRKAAHVDPAERQWVEEKARFYANQYGRLFKPGHVDIFLGDDWSWSRDKGDLDYGIENWYRVADFSEAAFETVKQAGVQAEFDEVKEVVKDAIGQRRHENTPIVKDEIVAEIVQLLQQESSSSNIRQEVKKKLEAIADRVGLTDEVFGLKRRIAINFYLKSLIDCSDNDNAQTLKFAEAEQYFTNIVVPNIEGGSNS